MEFSPLAKKDFKEILGLFKAVGPTLAFADEKVLDAQTFSDPDHDISYLFKALEGGKMAGLILGIARKNAAGQKTGYVKYFGVHPRQRRKGIGQAMFSELERRFQKREVREIRVGACPPPFLQGGVDIHDTLSVSFLQRRGYLREGCIVDMHAKLKKRDFGFSTEDKAAAKACKLRKASAADEKGLLEMLASEFPGWIFEAKAGLRQGTVFISEDKGKIASFACVNATNPGFYGPTGTLESQRGKGLARLLLLKCMDTLKKEGWSEARIPWVGPIPFYFKYAGAELGPLYWNFVKKL